MNKFNNWLLKNKDLISLYITAMIGVASILVGCVSIYVMRDQIKLQDQDSQPIFRIETELVKTKGDDFYNTEYLHIYNDGEPVVHYNYIRYSTIFHVEITEGLNSKIEGEIAIAGFYDISFHLHNLTGKALTTFCEDNNLNYYNLYMALLNKSINNNYYFISRFNLIEISYMDKHNNTQIVYYADNHKIKKEEYDAFPNFRNKTSELYTLENMSSDRIIEIIKAEDK